MRIEDLLMILFLFLLLVGFPTFIIFKLKGATLLNGVLFTLLFVWMIPEFSFLPTLFYFGFLFITVGANLSQRDYEKLSEEEKEERLNQYIEEQKNKEIVICPNCKNKDVEFLGNKRKAFSVGKAAAGGFLTGGLGTLAGFIGKEGKQNKWHCKECGNVFNK